MLSEVRFLPDKKILLVLRAFAEIVVAIQKAVTGGSSNRMHRALSLLGPVLRRPTVPAERQLAAHLGALYNWVYALSACARSPERYEKHLFEPNGGSRSPIILAYDLTGARHEVAANLNIAPQHVNVALNSFASNWIIGLGGRLSKAQMNSGDLRYGYFATLEDALQAACWMIFYSHQLSSVNRYFPTRCPFGIAITKGDVTDEGLGNLGGPAMDLAGHWLKEKLDHVAGEAGRDRQRPNPFKSSPLQVLCHREFESIPGWIPKGKGSKVGNKHHHATVYPIHVDRVIGRFPMPWSHKVG